MFVKLHAQDLTFILSTLSLKIKRQQKYTRNHCAMIVDVNK